MTYDLLKTAHIIVMAMWLGLEIAMFVLFSWHRSPAVSPDGRRLLGLVHEPVSFGPKIFWMPMLALGIGLAHIGRWGFEGPGGAVVVWLIAITAPVWIGAMGYLMWVRLGGVGSDRARDHASRVHAIDLGDTALRSAIVVWLGVIAVVSLAGDGPLEPSWLAWKVLLFCLLVSSSLAWKWLGKAIGQARGRVVAAAAEPGHGGYARLTKVGQRVLVAQWLLVSVIVWLAVAKPA